MMHSWVREGGKAGEAGKEKKLMGERWVEEDGGTQEEENAVKWNWRREGEKDEVQRKTMGWAVDQRHGILADREELRKQKLPAGPPARSPPS